MKIKSMLTCSGSLWHLVLPLAILAPCGVLRGAETQTPIDRHAHVTRHNIEWNKPAGQIPLGNGEFCFNTDATGLQTFGGNSMSHWGWHSFPLPKGLTAEQVPPTGTLQKGRNRGLDHFPPEADALRAWMFDNPHILNLGRLRLVRPDGQAVVAGDLTHLKRTLDLWTGVQTSRYRIDGKEVNVETCVHPELDLVAVRIESSLIDSGGLQVALDFGYPTLKNDAWLGDFDQTTGHATSSKFQGERRLDLVRNVDETTYHAALAVDAGGSLNIPSGASKVKELVIRSAEYGTDGHWTDVTAKVAAAVRENRIAQRVSFESMGVDPAPGKGKRLKVTLTLDGREEKREVKDNQTLSVSSGSGSAFTVAARGQKVMTLVCAYSPKPLPSDLPNFAETKTASAFHWKRHWMNGGAIDLSASKDVRWKELERRIVLSQYLMAAMSSGSWPSAENGLLGIDFWRGQFHMEMVWWHLAHYALWNRWSMAEEALGCYQRLTPAARQLASQLGYKGLQWPKSVGPEGRSAPWEGNQVLLWKQPHPIFLAELEYRLRPNRATLDKWADIIEGTATYMADYATKDEKTGIYSLKPAMPPSELGVTQDDVFDLAYWRWAFDKAQEWRQRMDKARVPLWDEARRSLAPLPVSNGVFMHSAEWTDSYSKRMKNHPDSIGVFGMLPPIDDVDQKTAHRTVLQVWSAWNWKSCWGWDFPWMAMAAARVGEPAMAVDALLKDAGNKNSYDIRGVNGGWYMPGNGGLLYAVAMMAAGWDGGPSTHAPGFPADGSWTVKWEGLKKAP